MKATIFFKKINTDVLMTVLKKDNGKWYIRSERNGSEPDQVAKYMKSYYVDVLPWDNLKKIFEYRGYIYYRRKDRNMFEQLGRNIFEFLIPRF